MKEVVSLRWHMNRCCSYRQRLTHSTASGSYDSGGQEAAEGCRSCASQNTKGILRPACLAYVFEPEDEERQPTKSWEKSIVGRLPNLMYIGMSSMQP